MTERRKNPRFSMNTPVLVSFSVNGYEHDDIGYLVNLSEGGVAVYTNRPLSTHRIVNLHLGTTIRELKKPVPFLIVGCDSSTDSMNYRFKVRAVMKENRKKNLQAISKFMERLKNQFSGNLANAFQGA